MRQKTFALLACLLLLAASPVQSRSANFLDENGESEAADPLAQPSVGVSGIFSVKKAPRGGTFQGAVVLGVPNGYHINSNRPTSKFMIPTSVRVTGPRGVRVSSMRYPRANVRSFSFAPDERIPVFEGNPAVRFDVTVPDNYAQDKVRLRVVVSYQACSDEACFRPDSRDITLSINVAETDEQVENINRNIFGRGRGRRS